MVSKEAEEDQEFKDLQEMRNKVIADCKRVSRHIFLNTLISRINCIISRLLMTLQKPLICHKATFSPLPGHF
eukprot:11512770-Ditylum_brightwellii.AAC.1